MLEYNTQNVEAAFEVLIEELEKALRDMNNSGANALELSDYDNAQRAIDRARHVSLLCEKITTLKEEWSKIEEVLSAQAGSERQTLRTAVVHVLQRSSILPVPAPSHPQIQQEASQPSGRLIAGRIRKGLRTPESAFYCPILQALSDLGGSAKRSEVFLILERSMRGILKPIDYQILSSEAQQMWRQNSAQWARNLMVKDGLLRSNSPPDCGKSPRKVAYFFAKRVALMGWYHEYSRRTTIDHSPISK